jgi:hypothetical protein
MRIHLRRAVSLGREGDLLVVVLDVGLAEGETVLHELLPHGARGAIAAEDHIGGHGAGFASSLVVEHARARVEVNARATMLEMQLHVREFLRFGEHHLVQLAATHAVDGALVDAVG